jgi:hypothetical protein
MIVEITDQERLFLLDLLDAEHKEMIHQIDHTDARDYRELLKQKIGLLEGLRAKMQNLSTPIS